MPQIKRIYIHEADKHKYVCMKQIVANISCYMCFDVGGECAQNDVNQYSARLHNKAIFINN